MKKLLVALLVIGVLFTSQLPTMATVPGTVVSVAVTSGSTTIKENPPLSGGYPTAEFAYLKFSFSPAVPTDSGSTFVVTTSTQCFLSHNAKGGSIYGQRLEEPSSSFLSGMSNIYVAVAGVDDEKYEGTHSCKVTGKLESPDASINGASTSKTITLLDNEPKPEPEPETKKTPAPTTTSKPVTTSTETSDSQEPEKPQPPATKLVDNEGKELAPSEGEDKVTFKAKQSIVITGSTIPGGIVKLYIFSEPQEAEVTADAEGNWSYTIESIEPGDHRVEVEVTDPESGQTSDREQVLAFAVEDEVEQTTVAPLTNTPAEAEGGSGTNVILVGVAAVLALCLVWLLVVSRMKPIQYIRHLIKH